MRSGEWTLRSRRVVTPSGTRAADVVIRGDTIAAVAAFDDPDRDGVILDVGDWVVLPGLIDLHVHVQEPGTADREGFETATRAAAAGGVTLLVDMPILNSPVTSTPKAFAAKLSAAAGKLWVDCGFHGGLRPGGGREIDPLYDAGVLTFLATMDPGPGSDTPSLGLVELRAAMTQLARLGRPLLLRTALIANGPGADRDGPSRSLSAHASRHPPLSQVEAIRTVAGLCRETGCRVHVTHLSTAEALPAIEEFRASGLPMTVETCPHYLTFAAEGLPDGDPRFKCIPPIRGASDRDLLWDALRSGLIDAIGSDHAPCLPSEKHLASGDVRAARAGIASLQLALPVVWTEARRRGFAPDDIARWMSHRPAEVVGLAGRKGAIAVGADADFAVVDPDASFVVDPNHLFHRHPETPYEGRTLAGRVEVTILRGRIVFESGRFFNDPHGTPILKLEETQPLLGGLDRLNGASEADAIESLRHCCGSPNWAVRIATLRPFASESDLLRAVDRTWASLERAHQIEAFAAHPRVSDGEALRHRPAPALDRPLDDDTHPSISSNQLLAALAEADLAYEAKFDHIFIADNDLGPVELLELIRHRLANDPEVEHEVAAAEQVRITRRRLRNLLA